MRHSGSRVREEKFGFHVICLNGIFMTARLERFYRELSTAQQQQEVNRSSVVRLTKHISVLTKFDTGASMRGFSGRVPFAVACIAILVVTVAAQNTNCEVADVDDFAFMVRRSSIKQHKQRTPFRGFIPLLASFILKNIRT